MSGIRREELLGSIAGCDVLVFGIDLDPRDPTIEALRRLVPDARFVTLTNHSENHGFESAPRSLVAAIVTLNRHRARVVIVAQDYQKLRALALLVPARTRLVVSKGSLERLTLRSVGKRQLATLKSELARNPSDRALSARLRPIARRRNDAPVIHRHGPKVSVYIPAYNAGKWLERAVSSALAQTLAELEICVCDDGSTDDTPLILKRLAASDPRVRWTAQANRGIGAASNAAVAMCRGEFILQLDADDELLPHAAETLAAELDADPELTLVYGGFEISDPREMLYQHREIVPPPYDPFAHLHGNVATHPRMFRATDFSQTAGFDESLENAVDFDIYLKLAEVGQVKAVPKVLYRYYIHGENTSVARRKVQTDNHIRVVNAALRRRGLDWQVTTPDPRNERKIVFKERRGFLLRWL